MVKTLHSKIKKTEQVSYIGKHMLEIITIGMYNEPRMVYREYIQNSADAIDEAINNNLISRNQGYINLQIDGRTRSVTITDNGIGISKNNLDLFLCSLGNSKKIFTQQRGFRGIGRLGGLGYCDSITFETKSTQDKLVSIVKWDAKIFKELTSDSKDYSLDEIIEKIVSISHRELSENDANHFFKVLLSNIHFFHKDVLMNIRGLKTYLSKNAPVPYNKELFSHANKITDHVKDIPGYNTYNIFLNNKKIYKPYMDEIQHNGKVIDKIEDIELITLTGVNDEVIAKGWYAKTNFLGAYPQSLPMKGIKTLQGNITVGNDTRLDYIYQEKRFSSWHIGEIFISYDLKLNARRDDIEPSKQYEIFLEYLFIFGRKLSAMCRSSSINRNREKTLISEITKLDYIIQNDLIIDNKHKENLIKKIDNLLDKYTTHELTKKLYDLKNYFKNIAKYNVIKIEYLLNIDFIHYLLNNYNEISSSEEIITNYLNTIK